MNKNEVRPLSPLTLGYVLAVSTCFLDLIVMSYVAKSLKVFDFDKKKERKKRKKKKKKNILSNLSKITQSVNRKGVDYMRTGNGSVN